MAEPTIAANRGKGQIVTIVDAVTGAEPNVGYQNGVILRSDTGTVKQDYYILFGAGVPGTSYNNAANGSLYIDTTNLKLHIKTADAAWTVVGAQTT